MNKYLLAFYFALLIWCLGILSSVLFNNLKFFHVLSPIINQLYSTVCHQDNGKLISINDAHFFVCARCTGIYLGILAASTIFIISFYLPNKKWNISSIKSNKNSEHAIQNLNMANRINVIISRSNFNSNSVYPLISASTILLIDVVCSTTGLYHYSKSIALITGMLFSSMLFNFVLKELYESHFLKNHAK